MEKILLKKVSFVFSLRNLALANITISEQGIFYEMFQAFIKVIRNTFGFEAKFGFDAGLLYQNQHVLQRWNHSLQTFLKEQDMEVFFRIVLDDEKNWYPNENKLVDFLKILGHILPPQYDYGFSFLIKRKTGMDKPSYVHQIAINLYFLTVMMHLPAHFKMTKWMVESEQGFYTNAISIPHGLIDTSYFFHRFLNAVHKNPFFVQNGCVVSRDGADIVCLLYSNYRKVPFDLSKEDFHSQQTEKVFLEFKNIEGTYRISEYLLDFNDFIEVYEMLFHLKHPQLRYFEKKMLQSKLLPELKIYEKTLSGQYFDERVIGSVNLVLLKFEKIS